MIHRLQMSPNAKLMDVMSRPVQVATPDQRLSEIDAFFAMHSGLPVVDNEGRCIGVVSKKDKAKAINRVSSLLPLLHLACSMLLSVTIELPLGNLCLHLQQIHFCDKATATLKNLRFNF